MLVAPKRTSASRKRKLGAEYFAHLTDLSTPTLWTFSGSLVGTQVLATSFPYLMESVLGDIFAGG